MTGTDGRGWVDFPPWMNKQLDRLRNWADRKADLPPQEALEFAERNLDRQVRIYGPDGGPTAAGATDAPVRRVVGTATITGPAIPSATESQMDGASNVVE